MDGHMFDGLGMAFVFFLIIGIIAGLIFRYIDKLTQWEAMRQQVDEISAPAEAVTEGAVMNLAQHGTNCLCASCERTRMTYSVGVVAESF